MLLRRPYYLQHVLLMHFCYFTVYITVFFAACRFLENDLTNIFFKWQHIYTPNTKLSVYRIVIRHNHLIRFETKMRPLMISNRRCSDRLCGMSMHQRAKSKMFCLHQRLLKQNQKGVEIEQIRRIPVVLMR